MLGILDWGVGGLGVYKAMREQGSTADVFYVSDAGFTPYGKLSEEALRRRLGELAARFRAQGVAPVLLACNAASSVLSSDVETISGVDFHSIVPSGVDVVEASGAKSLGVLGGLRTIASGTYQRRLQQRLGDSVRWVFQSAQPLSALVEAGELGGPGVERAVADVLSPFGDVQAVLLACTHYPALLPVLRAQGPGIEWLDPASRMAQPFREQGVSGFRFETTGDAKAAARSAERAFGIRWP